MTESILDLEALTELQHVMNDEFDSLLSTFLNDAVKRLAAIEAARSDTEALRRAAHAFKGSSSNIGAVHLAERCRALELYCRNESGPTPSDPDQVDTLIRGVESALAHSRRELSQRFDIA